MIRLIVNADDFGLTSGVNQSILELNRAGVLTSATLMATSRHFGAAAAETSAGHPADLSPLGIGCHVVLVDGTASLPHSELPSLTDSSHRFHPTLGSFVYDLLRGRIPEEEIELETVSQIRRLQAAGVKVTHLDTHKHTHMFARVLRPVLRAARLCGVPCIRNPFEADWSIAATSNAPLMRRIQVRLLRTQRRRFARLVREAGMATTDGAVGVLATGTLDHTTLERLLSQLPNGTWELVCHPAFYDEELETVATRLRESRATEHAALIATLPAFLKAHPDVKLIHFGQLSAAG